MRNPAIDKLVEESILGWVSGFEIDDETPTQIDNVYHAYGRTILVLLGNAEDCTPTLVSEFARIYSLPTHKYNKVVNQFRRYSVWLTSRNAFIKGFTEYDSKYYMVADKLFYDCYSRYGFCTACGILRCSPVWCICGHKQLSDGWTSNNKLIDELIKETQLQTSSPNHAYLEWIPCDDWGDGYTNGRNFNINGLPTDNSLAIALIALKITNETDDSYFAKLCDEYPDNFITDVWITIGFTYNASEQMYYLIYCENGLCLACTEQLSPKIKLFCYHCGASRLRDWTTGNKSLDSFIMESWGNTAHEDDTYMQWIEYSQLTDVQQMTSLRHGCTHIAYWLEPTTNESIRVTLKQINESQSLDFHQLTREYPAILTPDNIWIIGISQEPSSQAYHLVFYHEMRAILDKILRRRILIQYIQYDDFDELNEIGSGSYRTVYTARYNGNDIDIPETVVLKRFKNYDQTAELFISEFRNYAKCSDHSFLQIYGVTQNRETKEYMMVMQYPNNGSLLSWLDRNFDKLTWNMKIACLRDIAFDLCEIHQAGLVHCGLHGRDIVIYNVDEYVESHISKVK